MAAVSMIYQGLVGEFFTILNMSQNSTYFNLDVPYSSHKNTESHHMDFYGNRLPVGYPPTPPVYHHFPYYMTLLGSSGSGR
jgi:hypothetical protein